jgi:hypothetical protein
MYPSPNITWVIRWRRIKWVGHVPHTDGKRNAHRVLQGKPEGRRPLGRLRHTQEDNIKTILKRGIHWINGLRRGTRGRILWT